MKPSKKQLKKLLIVGIYFLLLPILYISNSYADIPIPSSYGTATHENPAWQELGNNSLGVSWNIWRLNETTNQWSWTGWTNDDLYVGEKVQFKFDVHKDSVGTHYADFLKAWVDWWGDDGTFNNADEVAFGYQLVANPNGSSLSPSTNKSYYSNEIEIQDSFIGSTWLRARVTCSESLISKYSAENLYARYDYYNNNNWQYLSNNKWGAQWAEQFKSSKYATSIARADFYEQIFSATGSYYQGEVEEWELKVLARTPNTPVPEPDTMFLLGIGLLGIARISRIKKQKKHNM